MDSDDGNDPDLKAAIVASLREYQASKRNDNSAAKGRQPDVVDLTGESDDDELVQVFPKSKSVIGSETDEEEDEDLKRAIELSMQGTTEDENNLSKLSESEPIDLEDGENNDLKSSSMKTVEETQETSRPMGLLGLDRKQMEQERLARAAKRKAEEDGASPSLAHCESKILKTEPVPKDSSAVMGNAASATVPSSFRKESQAKERPQTVTPSAVPTVQFPNGVVKKTWAFRSPRVGDDIKIEEVFQKSDLELAVLSSFQWDMDWLFSKLDTRRSRFLLVMQAKEDSTKRQYESETAEMRNLRLCFPPMDGQVNCMHSKLMLLFHPQYVRIVVPTANLVPYDWGELGGGMENSVFLIDLPKRTDPTSGESPKTAFYHDLAYFLRASTLHENIIAKLENFDFSKTAHVAFVHTIGGTHVGDAWRRTGYCGLGRAVKSLGLQTSKPLNIDYVTSSVGSLTDDFLRTIYLASQGDDGLTGYVLRTAKTFPAKSRNDPKQLIQKNTAEEFKDRFRVYFPSQATVEDSKGGPWSAGTICFQSNWYENAKFPRQVLRDCVSRRPRVLMHNKISFVRLDEPVSMPDGARCPAWAYVGSANLSESAWGRLSQDRTTKEPKLNCRNWECGVVIPVVDRSPATVEQGKDSQPSLGLSADSHTGAVDIEDIFQGTIPVPMQVPGRVYGAGVRPWFFLER